MNSIQLSKKEYVSIASRMLNLTVADFIAAHPILIERLNDVERLIQRVKKEGKLRSTQTIAMIICNYLESEESKSAKVEN